MNDNEQREELARDIFIADNCHAPENEMRAEWEKQDRQYPYAYDIADGLIAKGYRKPRTIMERFEDNGPDDLPPLSVVLSNGKPAIMQHDRTFMDHDGCSYDTWEMSYPMTVIHEPTTEATQ